MAQIGSLLRTACATLLTGGFLMVAPAPSLSSGCALEPGPARAVTRVVDSETLALDDGSQVRLIGALGPRLLDAADAGAAWPAEREARDVLEKLTLGKSVELGFSGRRTDRYGHLLAHVFIVHDGQRTWIQEQMLRSGHARAYTLPGNSACIDELLASERIARERGLGLWANAAYRIRAADDARELLRYRSTFQIAAGRVVRLTETRGWIFLNFGRDWREDFTIRARAGELASSGLDVRSLEGRRVEVRGWIERRSGPAIELRHASQLTVIPD